jgi:predicted amidohydrolase
MTPIRIALANLPFPSTPDDALARVERAIAEAAGQGAAVVCFPECYVPGYRALGAPVPPADPVFFARAHAAVAAAAGRARIAVVLGTERFVEGALRITTLVVGPDGQPLGSGQGAATPGRLYQRARRRGFRPAPLRGLNCPEGGRYPETVRWAAQHGAQVVFHPHFGEAEPGSFRPTSYGDPRNSFHEISVLCRAAENTCYFATVNCASAGSPTTSAVANPDGTLRCHQPHGVAGLLVADLDLTLATGLLARRCKS